MTALPAPDDASLPCSEAPGEPDGGATQRRRNLRGEGSRLRDEVIEAAMRILDRAPGTLLSLRMVAREAGVAAPSLYCHFEDADAMIREIGRECWRQLGAEMEIAGRSREGWSPLQRLQAQMTAYVRYAMLRPSRYQLLFAPNIGLNGEGEGPIRPAFGATHRLIEEHRAAGGALPADDILSSSVVTIAFVHGRIALAHLAQAHTANSAAELEAFVCAALERLFA